MFNKKHIFSYSGRYCFPAYETTVEAWSNFFPKSKHEIVKELGTLKAVNISDEFPVEIFKQTVSNLSKYEVCLGLSFMVKHTKNYLFQLRILLHKMNIRRNEKLTHSKKH